MDGDEIADSSTKVIPPTTPMSIPRMIAVLLS
jgi:hypothetical protein